MPAWFAQRAADRRRRPAARRSASGWKQFGTIELVSHSRFAYRALWKSVLEMIAALAAAGLVGGYLGSLVLRRLRKPLAMRSSTRRRPSPSAASSPSTNRRCPNCSQLAVAMNTTVSRLKTMFDEEATRLETVRREANCDPLTGLANRNHFMARLRESLADEDSLGGSLMLIRVANLADINHRLGRDATDELLRRIGSVVGQVAADQSERRGRTPQRRRLRLAAARRRRPAPARRAAAGRRWSPEGESFVGEAPTAHIGIGRYPRGLDASAVLAQVDAALAAAETEGRNAIREAQFAADEETPTQRRGMGTPDPAMRSTATGCD